MNSEVSVDNCSAESKEIKPIAKETIHRICSGQVVLSLAIAMKELVENALDAGATRIDILLNEFGSELLEVSDNGSGVPKNNFQSLTLKHYTSKIRDFGDLAHLGTLGFRGEALSSLCALSQVEITTKHQTVDTATKLKYDYNGHIISEAVTARQQGTTVALRDLFSTLPVRKKEFTRNLKKEFVKMCNLLYAYCLLPNGIRYNCTNMTKGSKSTVVATEGHNTVRENIISVFGVKQLASLIDVELVQPDNTILEEYGITATPGDELPFALEFLISSVVHGSGRSSSDRQFYYINQRPCEPSKVIKLVNEVYRQFNNKQYPFVYCNITTKSCLVDVNITPDKRQVFLEQEKLLLAAVKASLVEAFKQFPATFKMQNIEVSQSLINRSSDFKRGIKRYATEGSVGVKSILETFKKRSKSDETHSRSHNKTRQSTISNFRIEDIRSSQAEADKQLQTLVDIACRLTKEDEDDEDLVEVPEKSEAASESETTINEDVDITLDNPVTNHSDKREVPLTSYFQSFTERFRKHHCEEASQRANSTVKFRSNIAPGTNSAAEEELNRHITKKEFEQMEIIGQFNMGFIITRLGDDLFIVDQHATDEKYNFEQLQLNTVIENQKLVVPKLLELTAAAKSTLLDNEDVFRKNGFIIKREETSEGTENLFLTSIPVSEKTIFGKSDIDEMIFMLQEDSSHSKMCRPSRIRSMFASRACRKSVMIGKSLSKADMRRLVSHMGEIDQPWNCPHGRPTMRHLVNLNLLVENIAESDSS